MFRRAAVATCRPLLSVSTLSSQSLDTSLSLRCFCSSAGWGSHKHRPSRHSSTGDYAMRFSPFVDRDGKIVVSAQAVEDLLKEDDTEEQDEEPQINYAKEIGLTLEDLPSVRRMLRAPITTETANKKSSDGFPTVEEILSQIETDPLSAELREREEVKNKTYEALRSMTKIDSIGRSYGTGKRKDSVARVWLRKTTDPNSAIITVNGMPANHFFRRPLHLQQIITALSTADRLGKYSVTATVEGGGVTGQAQAVRHGIAKALQRYETELRGPLKADGLLTRDSRVVERKKPGQKKARKKFTWVKR